MYGSTRFKWKRGPHTHQGMLQFPATLALNTADDTTGVVQLGKPMGYLSTDLGKMAYAAAANFLGFLMHQVDAFGTTGNAGIVKFITGQTQIPLKRGQNISIRVPLPGSEVEMEGPDSTAACIEQLIVTSGTGALSGSTAFGTELGFVTNGGLRVAQSTDTVFAKMLDAGLTPVNAGEIRVRIQMISPYIKA